MKMHEIINLERIGVLITSKCTLKCKLCLSYAPYYNPQKHMELDYLERVFSNLFKVVDGVDVVTLSGGEPLMHPNIVEIYKMLLLYESQINNSVDMVINNTLQISSELLNLLKEKKDIVKIVLSDYGNGLSPKFYENLSLIVKHGIPHRISKFHGDNLYYNGWIDFTDHSLKWTTVEERDENASKCIHRTGRYFIINDGEIHCCSRGYWRTAHDIIPKIKGEYVGLLNENISVDEKRIDLMTMLSLSSSESCARCPGLTNDLKRHYPAEQL